VTLGRGLEEADYRLPGTNGLDSLAALRGACPEAPLILSATRRR
jgi:hypothetical protein